MFSTKLKIKITDTLNLLIQLIFTGQSNLEQQLSSTSLLLTVLQMSKWFGAPELCL